MTLYLLPNCFDDAQPPLLLLPEGLSGLILGLTGLIAENERTGRRYLIKLLSGSSFARSLPIFCLNEHSSDADYEALVQKIASGEIWGLISDAGMPGIADPGSRLVHRLRTKDLGRIRVIPGPSSILLALIASGLDGQRFSFHGYLSRESAERRRELIRMEKERGVAHVCIETPYRNGVFFADCLAVLNDRTQLCVACRLTYEDESVQTHLVGTWKKLPSTIRKEPTVFVFKD
jgi:16S rRNA (cytidine1402-2'-O)-methyltransferase